MDCQEYTTIQPERKRGQHLQREDRGAIQRLKRLGYSNRAIAKEIGCAPTTIGNELRRGTPPRQSNKGRIPGYSAKREEEGHWEGDTVIGLRSGRESVLLTLIEKKTENYLAIRIPGKTSGDIMAAMKVLRDEYSDRFDQVFKTITVDNGSEFAEFAQVAQWGTEVYFAHPYSSWERPQNERHNGLFRQYVPKGVSIDKFSLEEILVFADELNGRPRRKLGYRTPEELFEAFLDKVYAA